MFKIILFKGVISGISYYLKVALLSTERCNYFTEDSGFTFSYGRDAGIIVGCQFGCPASLGSFEIPGEEKKNDICVVTCRMFQLLGQSRSSIVTVMILCYWEGLGKASFPAVAQRVTAYLV